MKNSKAYFYTTIVLILLCCALNLITQRFGGKRCEMFGPNGSQTLVTEFPNFLSQEECDQLIALAEPNLADSLVYSGQQDDMNNARVSKQAWLTDEFNELVERISSKASEIVGLPKENAEDLQVVRYNAGGYFNPHYDACDGNEEFCSRMNSRAGPRYATFLIYLNDDFEGGETSFLKIDTHVKPERGKAVLFYNTDAKGEIIRDSLHSGNPVKAGTKWICNKWYYLNKWKQ